MTEIENKIMELKSCPFCGGKAYLIVPWVGSLLSIRCEDCGCQTPEHYNKKLLIDKWNTRVQNKI